MHATSALLEDDLEQTPPRCLRFGAFVLDPTSGELWRNGTPVRVQHQPGRVLALLAARAGEVVSREDVQALLWGDSPPLDAEQSLNFCIRRIRSALGDRAHAPLYVETLPRRGYRFVAPVERLDEGPEVGGDETDAVASEGVPAGETGRRAPMAWLAAGTLLGLLASDTPRSGDTPSAVLPVFQRLTFRQGYVTAARFGPDGDVLYAGAWEGRHPASFVVRPRSLDTRPLPHVPDGLQAVSDLGDVLFVDATGTLSRVATSGGPTKGELEGVHAADWTRAGLAVVRGDGPLARIEYPVGRVLCEALRPSDLRVSPDGSHVAFLEHPLRDDDRGDVVVVDTHGRRRTLSSGWGSIRGLAWTPDGEDLWFTAARSGVDSALHAVDLVEGGERTLLPALGRLVLHDIDAEGRVLLERRTWRQEIRYRGAGDATERDLSWLDLSRVIDLSRDGDTLLFIESGGGDGPGYSVYLRDPGASAPVRLGSGRPTALAPDASAVLVIPLESPDRIDVLPTAAGEVRSLSDPGIVEYQWAGFFPDGRRIVFAARGADGTERMYVRDLRGGPARAVTPPGVAVWRPTLSPDGSRLVAACADRTAACLYPIAGGDPEPLELSAHPEAIVGWADARTLYVRDAELPTTVARYDVASGRLEPWRRLGPGERSGIVRVNALSIAADGTYAYSFSRVLSDLYVVSGLK